MENLITAGIAMLMLMAFFAVPALLATLAAVAVLHFEEQRKKAVEIRPALSAARMSGAVASVLAVGLLLVAGSFAEDFQANRVTNGPGRQEHSLWPVVHYSADGFATAKRISGPPRREHSLWPVVRHAKSATVVDSSVAATDGPRRVEYSLWPAVDFPKSTSAVNPTLASR